MSETSPKPVIFLAFANDRVEGGRYLRNLPDEKRRIGEALEKAEQDDLCEVVDLSNTTVKEIFDTFQKQKYKDRIAIFHYGGHAGDYALLLETPTGEHDIAHSEGLDSFLAKQKGLQLIFINGCCSQKQAEDLIKAGVPAVIGTSQKINDEVATDLSVQFYNGLAEGRSLDRAWAEAVDLVKTKKGTTSYRDLYGEGMEETEERFPWDIYYRPGAEAVKEWNLPKAANDPLFGLPLPEAYYRKLPPTPFIGLQYFKKEDAAIFFGRGADIKKLYNNIKGIQPIILLYGKSGVGKSSLLDAGLIPRIENDHIVKYIRRIQARGLAGTLMQALQDVGAKHGLTFVEAAKKNEIRDQIEELQKALAGSTGAVRRGLESELQKLTALSTETLTLLDRWSRIEEKTSGPLIIILDQAEEKFTRPMPDDKKSKDELVVFLETVRDIFDQKDKPPKGKLVLSYRKEYHPEIRHAFLALALPFSEVFLQHLDREGIIEAVEGLTRHPYTGEKYRLKIEKSNDGSLPEIIADDLLEDQESPVAPMLQIMLTKLWNAAIKDNPEAPTFTIKQYQELKIKSMAEFFQQQMEKLPKKEDGVVDAALAEAVDSGLALDVLHFHTTDMSTARSCSLNELRKTYPDRQDIIDQLIGKCRDLYLLTEVQIHDKDSTVSGTSLAHDSLAPVVISQYSNSDRPGQRAARILSSKMIDFRKNENSVWLDEADLQIVEQGRKGRRRLSDEEEKLLKISRRRAKINLLPSKIEELFEIDNAVAIRMAQAAYAFDEAAPKISLLRILTKLFYSQDRRPFYQSCFEHKDPVRSAVFSPDGRQILTASDDGTAKLWSMTGELLKEFPHNDVVYSAVFSPDGRQILTASDKVAKLWSVNGGLLKEFPHGDIVYSAVFSPDGRQILTTDGTAKLWALTGKIEVEFTQEEIANTAVFSPDGGKILTRAASSSAKVWSLTGKVEAKVSHGDPINSEVFSPDSRQILTASWDKTAKLWSLNGEALAEFPHKGGVKSAVFSPDGHEILTASDDKTAKLWRLTGKFEVNFPHNEPVNSAVFSPDGHQILTASKNKTAKLWALNGDSLAEFQHNDEVESAVFSPNGRQILTRSRNTSKLWPLPSDSVAQIRHNKKINSAVFSPDSRQLLTASWDKTAKLWSLNGEALAEFQHNNGVSSAIFSPDGQQILTNSEGTSGENTAKLWSVNDKSLTGEFVTNKPLMVFSHNKTIFSAVFSPDSRQILTASADKTAKVWSLRDDSQVVFRHDAGVNSAVFSPDGRQILTASEDHTAQLWSVTDGLLKKFPHKGEVYSAIFSPDGRQILTASKDKTAKLWSLTDELPKELPHEGEVSSAIFSPDGRQILTESQKGARKLWSLTGEPLPELPSFFPEEFSHSAVFSPDGRQILYIKRDGTVILWSLTGEIITEFRRKDGASSAVFSPDGCHILARTVYLKSTDSTEHCTATLWLTPKGIYEWLKTANIYQLSEAEKREYGIIE